MDDDAKQRGWRWPTEPEGAKPTGPVPSPPKLSGKTGNDFIAHAILRRFL
jgi:hypothetical protein